MIDLINGDCLEVMRGLESESVDCVVTDPPYGLSFMGKKWDYDVPKEEIWVECLRVLKPGGYLLAFAGTRTQHRMAVRIEDAGFEIRDMIAWIYGSGFPKSLNIGKAIDQLQGNEREVIGEAKYGTSKQTWGINDGGIHDQSKLNPDTGLRHINVTLPAGDDAKKWEGWGTNLKPALEPITVARKPLSEKSVAENVLKWGTGGINIDECRVDFVSDEDKKDACSERPNFKNHNENRIVFDSMNGKGNEKRGNPQGRFPANLINDGSDEVVSLFPNGKSGGGSGFRKHQNGFLKNAKPSYRDGVEPSEGNASRFFYCAKASKSERNNGCEGGNDVEAHEFIRTGIDGRGNTYTTKPNKNHHPTVKPIALMEYLVKLVCPVNGVVLDPFMGSGTTGIACKNLGRRFIGIEIDAGYYDIAYQRIHQEPQPQATQESGQEETQEMPTIQQPKQRSLF